MRIASLTKWIKLVHFEKLTLRNVVVEPEKII
jgi:hypothetical protein